MSADSQPLVIRRNSNRHARRGDLRRSVVMGAAVFGMLGCAANAPGSGADSDLTRGILAAEDRRIANDPALTEGAASRDPRIADLARRATARIGDPVFVLRDSFGVAPPTAWPEPVWRLRYRALTAQRTNCAAIVSALADSAWPVRLRAADVVDSTCRDTPAIASTLQHWIAALPSDTRSRDTGGVSWHAAAHAITALARLRPDHARSVIPVLTVHTDWHIRQYVARAAETAGDDATLRALTDDRDPNVREAAIEGLARRTGHADDSLYVAALASDDAQVVRAAAGALAGSPYPGAPGPLTAALARWEARARDTERDVRVALRRALGRPEADPARKMARPPVPRDAAALALGAPVRLRVTMARASGGGSFVVRLRGDIAPITASRVLELVDRKYYDGLGWHRVEHDFVIQGGSPSENEYVGASPFFVDELGAVPHLRGTIGMSTRGHDTGDGQWFVNLRDNLRLGRDYTVFGEVVEGIDVVDGVMEGDRIESIARTP